MDSAALVRRGQRLRLETERFALVVDASEGGRIVEYSLDGRNVLSDGDGVNHGSTFWTSPQSDWSWPPPPEIDRDPYDVRDLEGRILLRSKPSGALGIAVNKGFAMARDGTVTIEYGMTNESDVTRTVAPWEVTRVARGGRTFFPHGATVRASPAFPAPPFTESDETVWLEHSSNDGTDRKLLADGPGGWLAHVDRGLLFLKTFQSILPEAQAPGEALVEIFVSGSAPYVELEQQGAYEAIAPKESLAWRVRWRLIELSNPHPNSATLTAIVRARSGR